MVPIPIEICTYHHRPGKAPLGLSLLKESTQTKGLEKVKVKKKQQAEEEGERGQEDRQEMLKKNTKKPSQEGSDNETSQ